MMRAGIYDFQFSSAAGKSAYGTYAGTPVAPFIRISEVSGRTKLARLKTHEDPWFLSGIPLP
tara:strand:- start:107 stop:292 length:186 start_codon:yes stop_codon:yes gene_type:complete